MSLKENITKTGLRVIGYDESVPAYFISKDVDFCWLWNIMLFSSSPTNFQL